MPSTQRLPAAGPHDTALRLTEQLIGSGSPAPPTVAASAVDLTRPLVSINKAGKLAGVSRRTIYNWIKLGKVEYVRTAGGPIRIYADTLFRTMRDDEPFLT